jgi:putative toxin-antitoxin system antitoxin component (TIGR02293 family)
MSRAPSRGKPRSRPKRRPAVAASGPGANLGSPYGSQLEADRLARAGLPVAAVAALQEASGLTLERIKQVARISEGSFARRRASGKLSPDESERLLRLGRVIEQAVRLFDGDRDAARGWLESPIPSLADHRPLELVQTEPGSREVEDLIGRISHGIVS